ncbi:MAG: pstB, partial [Acidimicrobiales bacterium]|nr:pstB [Acidimicrobiales bacterium]
MTETAIQTPHVGRTSEPSPAAAGSTPHQSVVFDVHDLAVSYGSFRAVRDVNLKIHPNEINAVIGPSGCGKSTVLRCFNRMNDLVPGAKVTKGSIHIDGQNIDDPTLDVI